MRKTPLRLATATLFGSLLLAQQAGAVDVNVADYTAAPAGTNLAMWYQQYTDADSYGLQGGKTLSNGTSQKSNTSIVRLIHFTQIGGITINPQILLPFGHVYDTKSDGQTIGGTSGMSDPIVGATIWLVNQPEAGVSGRYVALTPLVYVPVGEYNRHDAMNMGGNRWKGDLQLGWIEPLKGKLSMEWYADAVFYGDNSEAGNGSQRLEQDNSYELQGFLRYDLNPAQRVALGYAVNAGGKQYLDGDYNDSRTDSQQVRVEFQQMVGKHVQLSTQLFSDTRVVDGYKNDIGIKLRAMLML